MVASTRDAGNAALKFAAALVFGALVAACSTPADKITAALTESGVGSLIHYPIPPHRQDAYASAGYVQGQFPITEQIAEHCLSLPIGPHTTDAQGKKVVGELKKISDTMAVVKA